MFKLSHEDHTWLVDLTWAYKACIEPKRMDATHINVFLTNASSRGYLW